MILSKRWSSEYFEIRYSVQSNDVDVFGVAESIPDTDNDVKMPKFIKKKLFVLTLNYLFKTTVRVVFN